jgi:hypothetical protein
VCDQDIGGSIGGFPHAVSQSQGSNLKVWTSAEGASIGVTSSVTPAMDTSTALTAGAGGAGSSLLLSPNSRPLTGGLAGSPQLLPPQTISLQPKDAEHNEAMNTTSFHPPISHSCSPNPTNINDLDYSTYIDDIAMIVGGSAQHVEEMLIRAALKFQIEIVNKRKLKLSVKSTIVANDLKLAHRIAKELALYGITILVATSHRDLGIDFGLGHSGCGM